MTSDLAQRLRQYIVQTIPGFPVHPPICDEAANESERTRDIVEHAWRLFEAVSGSLGYGTPDDISRQDAFEDAMRGWRCRDVGHKLGPDQCGRPEHDVCWRCSRLASVLGYRRGERSSDGTWEYVPIEPHGLVERADGTCTPNYSQRSNSNIACDDWAT